MRVIGGKYRGKRFFPPKNFPSRPTTDFAKEALFNILVNRFELEDLAVLDLYAGTGSIGLEFLSRGARQVFSVDNHSVSFSFLKKTRDALNEPAWQVFRQDAVKFLQQTPQTFDIIFADPPYDLKGTAGLPDLVFASKKLNPGGLLIIEHGRETNFEKITQFTEIRNYGGVHFSFFEER